MEAVVAYFKESLQSPGAAEDFTYPTRSLHLIQSREITELNILFRAAHIFHNTDNQLLIQR